MKIEEMADIFLNSANFASHAFLNLAPPSRYALNLKALIKVSKVSWTSQLSYEILRSTLERKFDKTNFISPKSTPPKSPHLLGLKRWNKQYFLLPLFSSHSAVKVGILFIQCGVPSYNCLDVLEIKPGKRRQHQQPFFLYLILKFSKSAAVLKLHNNTIERTQYTHLHGSFQVD